MKHRLVSTQTLARVARGLQLGEHLRVGRGEEKTGGRRKRALLADAFEAVLAAVYIDGGFEAAGRFVRQALGGELSEIGRAACRERGEVSVGAASLKQNMSSTC